MQFQRLLAEDKPLGDLHHKVSRAFRDFVQVRSSCASAYMCRALAPWAAPHILPACGPTAQLRFRVSLCLARLL